MEMLPSLYPLLFTENLRTMVWGGERLRQLKGLAPDALPTGESWEVSAVSGSPSVVANGALAGRTLTELTEMYGASLLGERVVAQKGKEFPLLVKLIDAKRDLSIQVHPDDALARARHGCQGKTEMWYVMDAAPDATLYSGFSARITPEEYAQRVADGTICDVLARHSVKTGDVFFIPAGRPHAIGSGIILAEIQQSSDITYRIYDYNRLGLDGKPRQLHTAEAAAALDYKVYDDYRSPYIYKEEGATEIVRCPHFTVNLLSLTQPMERPLKALGTFVVYVVLQGEVDVCGVALTAGHSCLVPAAIADVVLTPTASGTCTVMEVTV